MQKEGMIEHLNTLAHRVVPDGGHVWLYGSRARGEAREDSDWDILILLDKESISQDDFDNISYPMIEAGWEYGQVVSPQLYTSKEWDKYSFMPFQKNVEHDKIVLL